MAVVYYVTYIDPKTGFLKRVEFDSHADAMELVRSLQAQGVHVMTGHFER